MGASQFLHARLAASCADADADAEYEEARLAITFFSVHREAPVFGCQLLFEWSPGLRISIVTEIKPAGRVEDRTPT